MGRPASRPLSSSAGMVVGIVLLAAGIGIAPLHPVAKSQEGPPAQTGDAGSVERWEAAPAQTGEPLTELLNRLLSDDPEEHDQALALIVERGESTLPLLEEIAVNDSAHPRHRAGAVYALGRIGSERSRQVLRSLWMTGLDQMGGALAIQTAISLGWYGDYEPLREMVAFEDEILGAKAAIQLGLMQDRQSLALLGEAAESEAYARMQPYFAIALGLLGDNRGEGNLRSGLLVSELRNHCAVALSRLGFAGEVVFELEFAMSDPDPLLRRLALDGLIELSPSRIVEILERAENDPDAQVQSRARAALRQIRERQRRPR
ncbi:MAG: HEAT repeat domain-containing protein [Bradymonadales bacterium]|nr:HEAT repeat domain-containing protein [Bradymonadales bacterium]